MDGGDGGYGTLSIPSRTKAATFDRNVIKIFVFLQVQVDPYLGISDDLQVYVKPQADIRVYGSDSDNQLAASMLIELRNKMYESDNLIMDIMVRSLSSITEV